MHELGVVFHIAKKVENIAIDNNAKHVHKVVLEIGEVTAIVPEQLIDCWNWNAKKSVILSGCELEIQPIKAVTLCEDCKEQYETIKYGKKCPYCGSMHTYLIQGNETIIKQIEVDD